MSVAMDEQKVRETIAWLEGEVPRDGARVKLTQYGGGPDEGQVVANKLGYLRLGIEFLKGAFSAAEETSSSHAAVVDLTYLVTEDSTINFDWFERRELIEQEEVPTKYSMIGIAFFLIFLFLVFAIIGAFTVVTRF
jgi:hypothetical protein